MRVVNKIMVIPTSTFERKMNEKIIAAFDFDGTITTKDSLLPFLVSEFGWGKTLWQILPLTPLFILFLFGKQGRKEVKEAVFSTFFAKEPLDVFERRCERYAKTSLRKIIRPKALEKIMWHKKQNHTLVLISASIETYLTPWAVDHGFSFILATLLDVDEKGCLTGKILGENCREKEKVRRFLTLFPNQETFTLYAYGDSRGDKELLALADHPFYRPFKDSAIPDLIKRLHSLFK